MNELQDYKGQLLVTDSTTGETRKLKSNADGSLSTQLSGSNAQQQLATIAINAALSNVVDLASGTLTGISMPAAWTAASITFDVSNDGINFGALFYQGVEYELSEAGASRRITVDPVALMPWRYIKVRSGKSGAVVNQVAQAVITLWTKPVA